jgi:hypothetical protein
VLTSGVGLTAAWREHGRGRWVVLGFGRGGERAGGRGGLGQNQPSRGRGEISFFLFLFLNLFLFLSFCPFNFLFLLNKKLSIFSWVSKHSM